MDHQKPNSSTQACSVRSNWRSLANKSGVPCFNSERKKQRGDVPYIAFRKWAKFETQLPIGNNCEKRSTSHKTRSFPKAFLRKPLRKLPLSWISSSSQENRTPFLPAASESNERMREKHAGEVSFKGRDGSKLVLNYSRRGCVICGVLAFRFIVPIRNGHYSFN